ncbi:omega-hydroxypalmitate O-feruloyl transferase [Macadamia integrifolia]|uniref:omega-hydroxypalmitate O-feruloyl transferase n=1 Tax=Macadamia integrifolia TaxID=60698 RepID=UPI001C4EE1C8|nr:omega-hydroxypalmitate O-feruloyl transferase [Macadamia integrifolia]
MASWIEELPHPPHLNISITIDNVTTVNPAGPIPANFGDCLYLSNLDDVVGSRVFTPTVYFYASNSLNSDQKPVGKILRNALASVLVPYYPFSGRLREAQNGKLEVYFGPKQGALLLEAHSEMSISDLGDLTVPNPAWAPLIHRAPSEEAYQVVDMPLVIAQVTTFTCGGFSLGLRLCHCLCDGLGAMQFISAWANTARTGTVVTSPIPCWDREFFRPSDPPKVKFPHTEFMSIEDGSTLTWTLWKAKPVQKCYRVSREFQTELKRSAQPNDGGTCTTFDAMAAHVWRSWVKALEVTPLDYELRLTFSVNARQKLSNPPLKEGFYGNVVCLACVTRTVSDLVEGRLKETTRSVREARLGISEEYVRSMVDYIEVNRPRRLEFGGKLTITQWTRFSMYELADFGWGHPVYAGPIDLTPTPQVCVLLPECGENCSVDMVVCICLPDSASARFREILYQID